MSEWKKYDETTFTDFGSVGETMPVDSGAISYDKTMPVDANGNAGIDMSPFEKTVPEIPQESGGMSLDIWNQETTFNNAGIENSFGETVRPATGWLVCISGATKGTDYKIYQGYSYIGRDPSKNQVAVPDPKISSVPSVRILYEENERKFYAQETSEARNPVYLNDKLINGRTELAPYDVIKLGDTKLMFVPLCTDKFAWEE